MTSSWSIFIQQTVYLQRNIEAIPYCNNCCSTETINITHSECVSVALGIHHAMRMRRIIIRGLSRFAIFFSTLSHERHDFEKKKSY